MGQAGVAFCLPVCLSLLEEGGRGFEFVGVALLKRPIFINIDSRNLYTSQKRAIFISTTSVFQQILGLYIFSHNLNLVLLLFFTYFFWYLIQTST